MYSTTNNKTTDNNTNNNNNNHENNNNINDVLAICALLEGTTTRVTCGQRSLRVSGKYYRISC